VVVAFRIGDVEFDGHHGEETFHTTFSEPCAGCEGQPIVPSAECARRKFSSTTIRIGACRTRLAPCGSLEHFEADEHVCRRSTIRRVQDMG